MVIFNSKLLNYQRVTPDVSTPRCVAGRLDLPFGAAAPLLGFLMLDFQRLEGHWDGQKWGKNGKKLGKDGKNGKKWEKMEKLGQDGKD